MSDTINQFVAEARGSLEEINRLLLALEANTNDSSLIDELFKVIHALNGAAGFINHEQLVQVSEHYKTTISSLRATEQTISPDKLEVFFKASELMNVLVDQVEQRNLEPLDIDDVLNEFRSFSSALEGPPPSADTPSNQQINQTQEGATPLQQEPPATPAAEQPSPSVDEQPSTSVEEQPSTSVEEQPSTSVDEQPSTSVEEQPSTSKKSFTPSEAMIKEANKQLVDQDMAIVVEAFLLEARDLFEDLEIDLPGLHAQEDKSVVFKKTIKQLRTIRSSSGFLSLEQVTMLAKFIEQLIQQLLDDAIEWHQELQFLLYASFGQLKECVIQVQKGKLVAINYDPVMNALYQSTKGHFSPEILNELPRFEDSLLLDFDIAEEEEEEDAGASAEEATYYVGPDHPLYSEGMKEIVESFIVETGELFDDLDNKLLDLEQNHQDEALVNDIFRAVHTIKGSAGFLSLDQLNQLTHHFEDVLNLLRRGDLQFHSDMMDVMFEAFDLMKVLQKQVIDMELEVINTSGIVSQLKLISEGKFKGSDKSSSSKAASTSSSGASADKKSASSQAPKDKSKKPAPKRTSDRSTETIRVEVERLDSLMNLVGELVLNRNRLVQIIDDVSHVLQEHDDLYRILLDTSSQLDFITSELQTGVMHTRMVQVGRIFNKFPRVVRDLAKDANKKINLVIEGAETELDKSLTEEIGDPLVHLIRNSVDHGVEPPDVRVSNGKDPEGTIRLSAQHEGNNIVIEIEDDGKGIDPEKLKKKAIEKGLISDKEAAEMADKEAFNLIFKAGFSTAETVTKISGRGVGMDVVKTNIAKMNGTISINSELGTGTTITLKLPLTLAINQSLLVRQGEETFAIPLHSVIEVVSLDEQKIDTINGREVIRIRERILPLVRIGEVLDIPHGKEPENAYAVVVGLAHHRIGLVTDDLVGQKEIVIKPLGNYLKKVEGIAGSTILGDGHVIMILDVAQLIRSDKERSRNQTAELEMA